MCSLLSIAAVVFQWLQLRSSHIIKTLPLSVWFCLQLYVFWLGEPLAEPSTWRRREILAPGGERSCLYSSAIEHTEGRWGF